MATGEGKTLTASLAASALGAGAGRPVHVITVNDYLVQRDAEEMGPVYEMLGLNVGHVIHETTPQRAHRSLPPQRRLRAPARSWSPISCATRSRSATLRTQHADRRRHADRAAARQTRLMVPGPVPRDRRRGRPPADRRSRHAADHLQLARRRSQRRRSTAPPTSWRSSSKPGKRFHDRLDRPQRRPHRRAGRTGSTSSRADGSAASGRASAAARNWSRRR